MHRLFCFLQFTKRQQPLIVNNLVIRLLALSIGYSTTVIV